jgi:hypothetical protein
MDGLAELETDYPHEAESRPPGEGALDRGRLTEADALLDQAKKDAPGPETRGFSDRPGYNSRRRE